MAGQRHKTREEREEEEEKEEEEEGTGEDHVVLHMCDMNSTFLLLDTKTKLTRFSYTIIFKH